MIQVKESGHFHMIKVELADGNVVQYQVLSKSVKEAREKVEEFMGAIQHTIIDTQRLGSVNLLC